MVFLVPGAMVAMMPIPWNVPVPSKVFVLRETLADRITLFVKREVTCLTIQFFIVLIYTF